MINYELKISLFGVWMLVIHFDSKLILKLLEKELLAARGNMISSRSSERSQTFTNGQSYIVRCSALSGFCDLLDFHI